MGMNELKIFENPEFGKIKEFQNEKPNPVMGIVYAIEYGDGFSKIGMTSIPANRTAALKHYITDYMGYPVNRIMISPWHTNYKENERKLHRIFDDCRIPNTELFSVTVQEIVSIIESGEILFNDNSKEILEEIKQGSEALIEFGKSVMRGDYCRTQSDVDCFNAMYENLLKKSDSLTEEVLFTARNLIDNYRFVLETNMEIELALLKSWFVDKWMEYDLLPKNETCSKYVNKGAL